MSNLKELISVFCTEDIQYLENKARELLFRLSIDRSEGTQLDHLGEIIGQSRLGTSDEIYRVLLKIRIGINNSEGDIERILTTWKLLTGTSNVKLIESFPARIYLTTTTYIGDTVGNLLIDLLQDVIAAGVSLEEIQITDPTRFGWGASMGAFGTSTWMQVYSV